jgi:hypothetical protein
MGVIVKDEIILYVHFGFRDPGERSGVRNAWIVVAINTSMAGTVVITW